MFYLTQFCRICIRNSGRLIDIASPDVDQITIADKLRYICAKMVITKEDHCQLMCYECVQKLRVSYLFQKQCAKADQVLERYLSEITSISPGSKFVNSELKVTIVPISQVETEPAAQEASNNVEDVKNLNCVSSSGGMISNTPKIRVPTAATLTNIKPVRLRRRLKQEASFRISEAYKDRIRRLRRVCPRITKQQRCMLLKSLLTKSDHNSNSPVPVRKSRKYVLYHSRQRNPPPPVSNKSILIKPSRKKPAVKSKGGLRDLLGFIKCYDFGYNVEESDIKEECNGTVLDRLESFSRTFFYNDFQAYRETILSLASDSESSDEDDMFAPYDEEEDRLLWPECNLSKGNNYKCNVTIKQEVELDPAIDSGNDDDDDDPPQVKEESRVDDDNDPDVDVDVDVDADVDLLPSAFVQACYEDQPAEQCLKQKINQGFQHFMNQIKTNLSSQSSAAMELSDPAAIVNHINRISVIPEASTSSLSSLDLLTRLTNSTRLAKDAPKTSAPLPTRCHLKCRTRGNPFINPQLMQQFQTRTFKCDTCNRSFKSPGYLHSHCTKMGH